jgi:hypothetical protein
MLFTHKKCRKGQKAHDHQDPSNGEQHLAPHFEGREKRTINIRSLWVLWSMGWFGHWDS